MGLMGISIFEKSFSGDFLWGFSWGFFFRFWQITNSSFFIGSSQRIKMISRPWIRYHRMQRRFLLDLH